mmetsp:Transcript_31109/g.35908  ORF Transcript_31109/g.35908 Transcript_31109/m.35908 type:complete len:83 (+) Transcript_31109:561-809(+)
MTRLRTCQYPTKSADSIVIGEEFESIEQSTSGGFTQVGMNIHPNMWIAMIMKILTIMVTMNTSPKEDYLDVSNNRTPCKSRQ